MCDKQLRLLVCIHTVQTWYYDISTINGSNSICAMATHNVVHYPNCILEHHLAIVCCTQVHFLLACTKGRYYKQKWFVDFYYHKQHKACWQKIKLATIFTELSTDHCDATAFTIPNTTLTKEVLLNLYLHAVDDCEIVDGFCNTQVVRSILSLLELNQLPKYNDKASNLRFIHSWL